MDDLEIHLGGKTKALEAPEKKAIIVRMGEKHVSKRCLHLMG